MKGSPLHIDFEKLWKEGMHNWHGEMPERMIDDALEEAFWSQSMQKNPIAKRMPIRSRFMKKCGNIYRKMRRV